jgi:hypothetical protein
MFLLFHEIFEKFEQLKTREERLTYLRSNHTYQFKEFLRGAFDPNVIFKVNIPKYRPAVEPEGLNYSTLHNEMDRMYLFVEGHPKTPAGITEDRKEYVLKNMLEAIHKEEALLLLAMLKKDLKIKFLTAKLVKEVYPDIEIEKRKVTA